MALGISEPINGLNNFISNEPSALSDVNEKRKKELQIHLSNLKEKEIYCCGCFRW